MRRAVVAIVFVLIGLPAVALLGFRISAARRESVSATAAAPRTGRFVRAADVEMYVQEAGPDTGTAVLLVHGTGAWSEIWRRTLDTLGAAGYHAVAIDLPPFGYSERPTTARYGDEAQARRILGVIAALRLARVTLVGHSFGARPTMEAFFLDDSHIAQLVLVDAALGLDTTAAGAGVAVRAALAVRPIRNAIVAATLTNPRMTARLLRGLVADTTAVTSARVAMLQQPFVRQRTTASYGQWLRSFIAVRDPSLATERARYRGIRVPTLVLWGEADSVTPMPQGKEIARLIPASSWVQLPRVGHIPAIEAPALFNAELLRWLARAR
ncbi:MAG TPA: alpha/beta hydrolase [Gemmatimonadaceae bacterium]|nr:alpha/beta hydrolase [Gemmatimonadaceae bacterium]